MSAWPYLAIACLSVACAITVPPSPTTPVAIACHPFEVVCAGGGCCPQDWACGCEQPDMPVTCEMGDCCDEENNPLLGTRRIRVMPQRRP
jgi:hypothetical protein